MKTNLTGVLEIDHDRGVIYFHVSDAEKALEIGTVTVLRICNLPRPIPAIECGMLDIVHKVGVGWRGTPP